MLFRYFTWRSSIGALRPDRHGVQVRPIDVATREALAIDVAGSIRSGQVIDVLSRLISMRGAPRYLRSDNGPEFVSLALLKWITDQGIECALIAPGKPWQTGTTESFNGKFRDECLAMERIQNASKRTLKRMARL